MTMNGDLFDLVVARKGHFLLESGHHGDLWLDLELLCRRPRLVHPLAAELAKRLSSLDVDVVCGALVEGAFVGLMVASELKVDFSYSERFLRQSEGELFPAGYRVPQSLRDGLRYKRVAIVNDVINAGSAVRGTFTDLQECGATIVAVGTLLVLGTAAFEFAKQKNVALESIATSPNNLWTPTACPLCASGEPLQDIADFKRQLRPSY